MTPPPDSLLAALRAVPMLVEKVWPDGADAEVPDYPALAAAAREWIREQLPPQVGLVPGLIERYEGYNAALKNVVRRLGLPGA